MKRLFQGGTVVSGSAVKKRDILIEHGKVLEVGTNLSVAGAEVVSVEDMLLFPGFVDAHTHFDLEVSDTVTADGFETGTKAELAGGTTCIIDFATQNKGESFAYALKRWHEKADKKASCDYGFHLAISDWNKEVERELEEIVAAGVTTFKLYMTYDAMVVDDQTIYEVLSCLKRLGAIAGVHCENKGIIDARLEEVKREKGTLADVADYPKTRPALAEAEAIGRLLKIAKCVDTPVIVVHLSSKEGYEEILRAREGGQTVYVETCPQYLVMDESRYLLPQGRNYAIAPPLRTAADQEVLWQALQENQLQTISTDHCSFTTSQKSAGKADFSQIPCGMPGAEERPALIYHFGVNGGRLTLEQMCRYLAENPAKLYGMYPDKGCLLPGSDADIVVWDPKYQWVLSAVTQKANIDYAPLEGTVLQGKARQVYLHGELVVDSGNIIKEHMGRYIKREAAGRDV